MRIAEIIRTAKVLALQAYLKGGEEFQLREAFRWYSEKFSTELHIVETLPLESVLMHYYEGNVLPSLEEKDGLRKFAQGIVETPEEQLRREIRQDLDEEAGVVEDDEFEKMILAEELQNATKSIDTITGALNKLDQIKSLPQIHWKPDKEHGDFEANLPMEMFPEENQKIKRISKEEMDEFLELDALAPKKQS